MEKSTETKVYFGLLFALAALDVGLASWVLVKAGPGTDCRCGSQVFVWMIGNLIQFSLYLAFLFGQLFFDRGTHKRMTVQIWNVVVGALFLFGIGWTIFGWYVILTAEASCCTLMWRCALACVIISTGQCIVAVLTAMPREDTAEQPVKPEPWPGASGYGASGSVPRTEPSMGRGGFGGGSRPATSSMRAERATP
mmetsp:Transcript_54848/g.120271  ORF Transcript_54848/g.120271 Transcript_54848/m.120271 type:complete len:195 (+) Transcript_54848:142-726(+)